MGQRNSKKFPMQFRKGFLAALLLLSTMAFASSKPKWPKCCHCRLADVEYFSKSGKSGWCSNRRHLPRDKTSLNFLECAKCGNFNESGSTNIDETCKAPYC